MTSTENSTSDSSSASGLHRKHFPFPRILVLLIACLLCSCTTPLDDMVFFITIHEVISQAENIGGVSIIQLTDPVNGKKIFARGTPLLSSRQFRKAETIPDPRNGNKKGIRLYLDPAGVNLWRLAVNDNRGGRIAIAIDSFLVTVTTLPRYLQNEEYMDLPAIWPAPEAERIARQVETNYFKIND